MSKNFSLLKVIQKIDRNGIIRTITDRVITKLYFYRVYLVSTILAVLAFLLFLTIGFPESFNRLSFFSQRWFGLGFLMLYLIISYLSGYLLAFTNSRLFSTWVQSNLLLIISLLYYSRINFGSEFTFWEITFTSRIMLFPLSILIFIINLNLFGKLERKLYYLLPQILLFSLQLYSFLEAIKVDSTFDREFFVFWIEWIFRIDTFYWILFSGFSIAAISIFSLEINDIKKKISHWLLFGFLSFQILLFIYLLKLPYWYQTLLFLIVWDYIFVAYTTIAEEVKDDRFFAKFLISSFYHCLVFLAVIFTYLR
jgi:hypothetical protein